MKKNRYYDGVFKPPKIEKIPTLAQSFLLPCLGMNLNSLKLSVGKKSLTSIDVLNLLGYINTYMFFEQYEENQNECCFILIQPSNHTLSTYFPAFYSYISSLPTFIDIKIIDIGTIVLTLKVEDRFGVNPKKQVLLGRYSKLTEKFARFYFNPTEEPFRIIMKTTSKKMEIERMIGEELDDSVE